MTTLAAILLLLATFGMGFSCGIFFACHQIQKWIKEDSEK